MSIHLVPHIEDEDRPLDIDFDALDAALEDLAARRAPRLVEVSRAANRALGAPSWVSVDLSDADPLWKAHTCISDDFGACPDCTAYQAAGGVL